MRIYRLGNYRTARGESVKIYKIVPGDYGCFGEFDSGTIQVWDASGRLFRDKTTEGDITEIANASEPPTTNTNR